MADLQTGLRGSAETWRSNPPAPEVPEELLLPRRGSVRVEASGVAATPPAPAATGGGVLRRLAQPRSGTSGSRSA